MKMTIEAYQKLLLLIGKFKADIDQISCIKNSEYTQALFEGVDFCEKAINILVQDKEIDPKQVSGNFAFQLVCDIYRLKFTRYLEIRNDEAFQTRIDHWLRVIALFYCKAAEISVTDIYRFILYKYDLLKQFIIDSCNSNIDIRLRTTIDDINLISKHNGLIRRVKVDSFQKLSELIWLLIDLSKQVKITKDPIIDEVHFNICLIFARIIVESSPSQQEDFAFFANVLTPSYIRFAELYAKQIENFRESMLGTQFLKYIDRSMMYRSEDSPILFLNYINMVKESYKQIIALYSLRSELLAIKSRATSDDEMYLIAKIKAPCKDNKYRDIQHIIKKLLSHCEAYKLRKTTSPWLKEALHDVAINIINNELNEKEAKLYTLIDQKQLKKATRTETFYQTMYTAFCAVTDDDKLIRLTALSQIKADFIAALRSRKNFQSLISILIDKARNPLFRENKIVLKSMSRNLGRLKKAFDIIYNKNLISQRTNADMQASALQAEQEGASEKSANDGQGQVISPRGNETGSDSERKPVSPRDHTWCRIFTASNKSSTIITNDHASTDAPIESDDDKQLAGQSTTDKGGP